MLTRFLNSNLLEIRLIFVPEAVAGAGVQEERAVVDVVAAGIAVAEVPAVPQQALGKDVVHRGVGTSGNSLASSWTRRIPACAAWLLAIPKISDVM